jgi:mRNA interferase RelE/StbE
VSGYTVYVTPAAWKEIKQLPGHVRQRVRRAVDGLAENPRPAKSKKLDVPEL